MKNVVCCLALAAFMYSCSEQPAETPAAEAPAAEAAAPLDLPYTAEYSSSFTADVSDADLKTVLQSYKDWENGDMAGLATRMADSIYVTQNSGDKLSGTNAEIIATWTSYRDSLSSIKIQMEGWQKMYATDKKEGYIVTWYKEYDTYKDGRVDSAHYHDINQLKDGKISWFSSYKRPMK